MREAQAQALASKIAAAWPDRWRLAGPLTNTVYVERLQKLDRYPAAAAAIDALIDTEVWLPPVAKIFDEYRRYYHSFDPPALEEGDLTAAQRAENISRARALLDAVSRSSDDTTDGRDRGRRQDPAVLGESDPDRVPGRRDAA